jgi:hypothetical protein
MNRFRKGDKVIFSKKYGIGNDYGIGESETRRVFISYKKRKLTVLRYQPVGVGDTLRGGAIWFDEIEYYWPPDWFELPSIQLEFNFDV